MTPNIDIIKEWFKGNKYLTVKVRKETLALWKNDKHAAMCEILVLKYPVKTNKVCYSYIVIPEQNQYIMMISGDNDSTYGNVKITFQPI